MPDHLHALFSIRGEISLGETMANFKRATRKFCGTKWHRNFSDHRLRSDESLEQKARYIRQNPVRAGLVKHEDDWPYVLDRAILDAHSGKPRADIGVRRWGGDRDVT